MKFINLYVKQKYQAIDKRSYICIKISNKDIVIKLFSVHFISVQN